MKILLSSIILSVLLLARSNPFEPTETYAEKKQQLMEEQARQEEIQREKKLAEQREKLNMMAMKQQEIIEETNINENPEENVIELKPAKEEPKVEPKVIEKVVEKVVERVEVIQIQNYELLPFLSARLGPEYIQFSVDKKYKFIDQMIMYKNKKFIFDFQGKVNFYTKRKMLKNPYFESIVIGNHPKKKFFRVVIKVKDSIKNYKESIDSKNFKFTIKKI